MKGLCGFSEMQAVSSRNTVAYATVPPQRHKMPRRVSGAARVAQRAAILALKAAHPEMGATEIGRKLGGLNESTVRNVYHVYHC